jgi:DNA-binding MarR family transcriptional regulator
MNNTRILLTNPKLVESFSLKEMDALAIYYKAKRLLKNSVIYDWSYNKISQKLCISYHKANKYIKILKKKGFVYEHGNNLVFISQAKIIKNICWNKYKRLTKRINIQYSDNIQDIKDKLLAVEISCYINQQKYIRNLRSDISKIEDDFRTNKMSKRRIYKLTNIRKKNPELAEKGEEYNIVNCRKFSKNLNISQSTTCRMLNRLQSKGYINREKIVKVVDVSVSNGFNDYINNSTKQIGYCYISNNKLYNYIGTHTTINNNIWCV